MVTIEELKLGNRTLEALEFLLSQITELETAISQINISEIKDANTLTKEQIATLQDVKNAVEAISSDLNLKKADFDEKKADFDSNMSAFRNDKADFDEKKADFDSKNNTALSNFAFISSNVEKINSTSALLAEAENVLKTIKLIEQRTQAALDTIANSQAKFVELNALKSSLEALKTSLESLVSTGVIDDTKISVIQTYSSKKIEDIVKSTKDSLTTDIKNAKDTLVSDIKTKTDTLTADIKTKTDALGKVTASQAQSITVLDSKITSTQNSLSSLASQTSNALNQKVDIVTHSAFATQVTRDLNQKLNISEKEAMFSNGKIKTEILPDIDATTLNGETKEQLLKDLNATTLSGKTLSQVQSSGKFGSIRLITDDNNAGHYYEMFAVNEDEELIYWGFNHNDQMMMTKVGETNIPFIIIEHPLRGKSKIKQITQISSGYFLLYENGDLYGRGFNNYYALGIGNTANQYAWVKITDNVKKFCATTGYYSVRSTKAVIKKDGSVWFWGENAYGQAGIGNTNVLQVPTKVPLTFLDADDEVIDLVLNDGYYASSYLITKKGKLYTCGYGSSGQLGLNDTTNRTTFTFVSALQDEKVLEISHTSSFEVSGTSGFNKSAIAKCEGNKFYITGQTGGYFKMNVTSDQTNKFIKIDRNWFPNRYDITIDPLIECFVIGRGTVYYLTKLGKLFAQGFNDYCQIGNGTRTHTQQISEITIENQPNAKFKRIRATCPYYHPDYSTVFADVEIDGETFIYSWGYNGFGNAAANSAVDVISKPIRFYLNPDKVKKIKRWCINGYASTPAMYILLDNGQVYGWGYNANNQVLGNGSTVSPITFPTRIL